MANQPRRNILFLPGLLCDRRLFTTQIQAFEGRANIVVADLTTADRIEQLAANVINDNLQENGPWAIIALSMGGYVAFELLRQAGGKFNKVVLMNTSARPDTDEQKATRHGLIQLAEKGEFKGVTPRLLPRLIHKDHLNNNWLTSLIQAMAEDTGKDAFIRQQTAIIHRVDSRPFLPEITQDTLVIASQDDIITPPELLREISALSQNSQLKVLNGAGHLLPLEQPEPVNQLIENFIF